MNAPNTTLQTNEFQTPKPTRESTTSDMMVSRQAQEVQAAIIIAKKFPRDQALAFDKIMQACKRVGLAKEAEYTYPRGGEKINGATIRLAEAVAQNWGNIDYGIIELSNNGTSSEMMAYAWDLETNTRVSKVFSVAHKRDTKQGAKVLTDGRDIYEATANFGARRVRACIIGIIPGDVMDSAVEECRKTLTGAHKDPLSDRFRKIVTIFETDFLVSKTMIEKYLGYDLKSVNENDYIRMQGVYRSLRDAMSKPTDFFEMRESTVADPLKKVEPLNPQASTNLNKTASSQDVLSPEEKAAITASESKQK